MAITVGDAVLKLGVDKTDLDKGLQGIKGSIQKHSKAIGIGMVAAGGVILGGFAMGIKAASDFEGAMREVNTMMGLSQDEFTDFSKEVQSLASDLGVDAVESAKALYQAISAGIPRENAIEFLSIATKAAIGGVTDTATAVDGLSTVINAFKLPLSDTQKVADVMFTTVKGGKTTFEELSASLFQVAPIAAASGVRFEEVSAALATLTKQGVPTKIATTQLRQAMVALQKPTEDMGKTINALGYESGQAMLQELGLAETLNTLRDASAGSNELLMKMFGSVEAGQAVLALTGDNAATFTDDLLAMAGATGAATDAFNEMEKSTSRQVDALKSTFKGMAISIGDVLLPILSGIVDFIKPIVDSIKEWMDEHPGLTKVIVIGTAAFGALLIVLGSMLLLMPGLTTALAAFGITLHVALGPISLITLGIAGLIAAGIALWKNWDKVVDFFKMAWIKIKIFFLTGVENILKSLTKFTGFIPWLGDKVQEAHDKISSMIDAEKIKEDALKAERSLKKITKATEDQTDALEDQADALRTTTAEQLGLTNAMNKWMALARGGGGGGIGEEPFVRAFGESWLLPSGAPGRLRGMAEHVIETGVMPPGAGDLLKGMVEALKMEQGGINIYVELDGRTLAKAVGAPLVEEIRLKTGVRL